MVGSEDEITPPTLSADLGGLVRGSRVEIINAAGHLSNAEQPKMFNMAVDRFLSEIEQQN